MIRRRSVLAFLGGALLLTAVGSQAATQYVAASLRSQRALGASILTIGGIGIYPPWRWSDWDEVYRGRARRLFLTANLIAATGFGAGWLPFFVAAFFARRHGRTSTAHGSARWARTSELARAGLLTGNGVVLCQTDAAGYVSTGQGRRMVRPGRLLSHDGPEHVMVFAPTRSGKGVGTVIPTLLNWRESVVAYDIKKELWTLTAGWRRQFSRCWCFEPTSRESVRFNPLLEIRRGDNEVRDTQNVADILVDPDGRGEKRDHWKLSALNLLVGTILHVLYAEPDKSLTGVAQFLSNPDLPLVDSFHKMLLTQHLGDRAHPVVAQCAREMLDKSENELAGIVSTAKTCVNLYNDPLISRNTTASDFRIADLMNGDAPVSLYLVVPPSDIDRTRPLVRLVLNQIGRRLTERMEFGADRAYKHRLLFLLDEFPSLGRLEFFQTQLAYLAGYGIKAFLIAQSLNQLEATYGQHNSILDNCHIRMTYTANDDRTAKRISDLVGTATHVKVQRSYSGGRLFRNVSESEQEHGRPLLTPDEVLRLPFEDAILLVGGSPPYRARKIMYYLDRRFRDCTKLPAPDSPRQRRGELLRPVLVSDWHRPLPALAGTPSELANSWKPAPAAPFGAADHSDEGAMASLAAFASFLEASASAASCSTPKPSEDLAEHHGTSPKDAPPETGGHDGDESDEELPL